MFVFQLKNTLVACVSWNSSLVFGQITFPPVFSAILAKAFMPLLKQQGTQTNPRAVHLVVRQHHRRVLVVHDLARDAAHPSRLALLSRRQVYRHLNIIHLPFSSPVPSALTHCTMGRYSAFGTARLNNSSSSRSRTPSQNSSPPN